MKKVKNSAKIHQRKKFARWKRRQILLVVRWPVLAVVLVAAVFLASHYLGRFDVFKVQGVLLSGAVENLWWERDLTDEVFKNWRGKSRLACFIGAAKMTKDLAQAYPCLENIHISLWPLISKGRIRVNGASRKAAAVMQIGARKLCLDSQGLEFPCMGPNRSLELPELDAQIPAELRRHILRTCGQMNDRFGISVAQISRFGTSHIVFRDKEKTGFEFAQDDVMEPRRTEEVLRRLSSVLGDLGQRQEKFRYIDISLSREGRIFVTIPKSRNFEFPRLIQGG